MSAYTKCKHLWIALAVRLPCPGSLVLCSAESSDGRGRFPRGDEGRKSSGVWIDGQYVGYMRKSGACKKILLLPGEHQISVRQTGYIRLLTKNHRGAWADPIGFASRCKKTRSNRSKSDRNAESRHTAHTSSSLYG